LEHRGLTDASADEVLEKFLVEIAGKEIPPIRMVDFPLRFENYQRTQTEQGIPPNGISSPAFAFIPFLETRVVSLAFHAIPRTGQCRGGPASCRRPTPDKLGVVFTIALAALFLGIIPELASLDRRWDFHSRALAGFQGTR